MKRSLSLRQQVRMQAVWCFLYTMWSVYLWSLLHLKMAVSDRVQHVVGCKWFVAYALHCRIAMCVQCKSLMMRLLAVELTRLYTVPLMWMETYAVLHGSLTKPHVLFMLSFYYLPCFFNILKYHSGNFFCSFLLVCL